MDKLMAKKYIALCMILSLFCFMVSLSLKRDIASEFRLKYLSYENNNIAHHVESDFLKTLSSSACQNLESVFFDCKSTAKIQYLEAAKNLTFYAWLYAAIYCLSLFVFLFISRPWYMVAVFFAVLLVNGLLLYVAKNHMQELYDKFDGGMSLCMANRKNTLDSCFFPIKE